MKKIITFLFLVVFASVNVVAQPDCQAAFFAETNPVSQSVFFNNQSFSQTGNIVANSWDFDDGASSQEENPVHVYQEPGYYLPCLTIFTTDSCVSTMCDTILVGNNASPCDAFVGYEFQQGAYFFYAESQGTSPFTYLWTFSGNGIEWTSVESNPFVEFWDGLWTVTVTITDANGCSQTEILTIEVGGGNTDDCYSVANGLSPYSQDDPIFQEVIANDPWCCNDGWDSICQDAYDELSGGSGQDSCVAIFEAYWDISPATGILNIIAYALVDVAEYTWTISDNDEIFSGVEFYYPIEQEGIYTICLSIETFDGCSDTQCQDVQVNTNVSDCNAAFTYQIYEDSLQNAQVVNFVASPNDNAEYIWLLWGPNQIDTLFGQNVTTILEPGGYEFCLFVDCGNDFNEDCGYFEISDPNTNDCYVGFEYYSEEGNPFTWYFYGYTQGWTDIASWYFDFGDGTTSNAINPTHTYAEPGIYDVVLVTTDINGNECTFVQTIVIEGGNNDCAANFTAGWDTGSGGVWYIFAYTDVQAVEYIWEIVETNEIFEGPSLAYPGNVNEDYTICLNITTADGCVDSQCQDVLPAGYDDNCNAEFTYEIHNDSLITFTATPNEDATDYSWLFWQANEVDTLFGQIVTVVLESGIYDICLFMTCGNELSTSCDTLIIDGTNDSVCNTILNGSSPYSASDLTFQAVIAQDSYCCDVYWDGICQQQYYELNDTLILIIVDDPDACPTIVNGTSPYPADDPIFQAVIEQDEWCCLNGWDALCQCQYDELSGVVIGDSSEVNIICGDVFAGSPNISTEVFGTVYLIAFDPQNLTLMALDTQEFGGGETDFCFELSSEDLAQQPILYLKAALAEGSPYYENLMPTYYEDALMWFNAQPVSLGNEYTVYLVPGYNPGGPGFVEGAIIDGAGKTENEMANVPVLITHLDRSPVAYTMTDENGEYDFSDLPYGTYQLTPDVWGQRITPTIITISETTPSVTVEPIEIETTVVNEDNTGLNDLTDFQSLEVYPNPTNDNFTIHLNSVKSQRADFVFYNILGKQIEVQTHNIVAGDNQITQDISHLYNGVYFLEVRLEDGSVYGTKVIKN